MLALTIHKLSTTAYEKFGLSELNASICVSYTEKDFKNLGQGRAGGSPEQ